MCKRDIGAEKGKIEIAGDGLSAALNHRIAGNRSAVKGAAGAA